MARRGLLWQLFPPLLIVMVVSLALATIVATRSFRSFYRDQTADDLRARAVLVQQTVTPLLGSTSESDLQDLCRQLGEKTGTRLTIILPDGRVVADSQHDPATMDNHGNRPEVQAALSSGAGMATRFSWTLRQEMMYVAVTAQPDAPERFVVRAAVSLASLDAELHAERIRLLWWGGGLALVAAGFAFLISRRFAHHLAVLRRGAERFAAGDLDHRLAEPRSEEFGALARSMNLMAAQLGERIGTIDRQRGEQDAILASMREGVLALDSEGQVILLNEAVARLLGLDRQEALGQPVQALVRHRTLLDLVADAGAQQPEEVVDLTLTGPRGELNLQAQATALRGAEGRQVGTLVVLRDVTRLRRLETVRRDFVANVSHELRTPVTAIQGYLETLLDHAPEEEAERRRFLQVVTDNASRLEAIIDDLLSLSRLELDNERGEIELSLAPLAPVVEAATLALRPLATDKQIELAASCPGDLRAWLSPPLMEQALVNLVENAIKFSNAGSRVDLVAEEVDGQIRIEVRDQGPGIPAKHQPRIFERFYRVEKARSRKLGGTGLGLAIVKHIVRAHRGEVSVHSEVGQGSTFRILLPPLET